MLTMTDVFDPIEWGKSFIGDGLPPGPDDDFYTGINFAVDGYFGRMRTFIEAYREFGPVFTGRFIGFKMVWMIGAEANQYMYVDNWEDFAWWGESLDGHLAGLIGEGLLSSHGETHDKARKLLDPVFSRENLKTYTQRMIDQTERKIQELEYGQEFDFYDWAYDTAILNATACFMGMDPDRTDTRYLHEHFDTCVKFYQKPFHLQALRGPFTPYAQFKKAKEKLDDFLYDEIEARRRNGGSSVDNILDRLLEAEEEGETFTDEEIHDQIMTLYWAGHDTTTSAVSWLVMLLGLNYSVYEKVKKEVRDRVGDQPVTVEEVTDGLPYLEMAMDEALRLYPPAWVAIRKALKPFELYGHRIPEGTNVAFSSILTHRLPHLYEQPEAFHPERMKPKNKRDLPPGAYIPFGRGPRTCIGMNFAKYEIKLIVATLLRHFDFELLTGQNYNGYPVATLTPETVEIRLKEPTESNRSVTVNGQINPTDSEQTTDADSGGESDCPVH
ncbi:MAG: cytochrome P450 [bacterium]